VVIQIEATDSEVANDKEQKTKQMKESWNLSTARLIDSVRA
jgi:hypothetical protein